MNAWNDTKAINFKQVTDYRKANIIVNAGNYSNTGWAVSHNCLLYHVATSTVQSFHLTTSSWIK